MSGEERGGTRPCFCSALLWERACSRWRPVGRSKFCSELNQQPGRPVGRLGLAAPGHGWPMAAGPRSRTGARECRAWARHRMSGAKALGYLALFQVTRRKGGTNSGRNRRNGYVHHQKSAQTKTASCSLYKKQRPFPVQLNTLQQDRSYLRSSSLVMSRDS
ncbi:hypothetical protein D3C75_714640 [compost metagenome]